MQGNAGSSLLLLVEENVFSDRAGREPAAVPVLRTDLFPIEFGDPLNDDFLLL